MKRILFGILMLSALVPLGCESYIDPSSDEDPDISGFVYAPGPRSFAPRDVDYVWVSSYISSEEPTLGVQIVTDNRLLDKATDPDCGSDTWMQIDTPIPAIEKQCREWCSEYPYITFIPAEEMIKFLENYPITHPDVMIEGRMYPKLVEYRTEGIVDLQITADKPLFGQAVGSSLNGHFIVRATWYGDFPAQTPYFSSKDFNRIHFAADELVDSNGNVMLNDWLARKPLAMADFWFFAVEPITDLAAGDVTITVDMTTTTGKRFKASNKVYVRDRESDMPIYKKEFLATRVEN